MAIPSKSIEIIQVAQVSDELLQACQRLVPQLTSNNPPPSRAQLEIMLSGDASTLFMAIDQADGMDHIVGLATLIMYRVPTGLRGYIEDVVVDDHQRGKGIGEALTQACLDKAEQAGCPQVMLTCNPGREAANRLYQRMGFELRKTNVYKFRFSDSDVPEPDDQTEGDS
jgi:ribosomal protein S18 acetylase RimI-like enzyme